MNPALWADIRRDLGAAERYVQAASRRARFLADAPAALDPEIREDREAAVGLLIHNCYGAMESVLERIVQAVDGGLPTGPAYLADLVRRAETVIDGSPAGHHWSRNGPGPSEAAQLPACLPACL